MQSEHTEQQSAFFRKLFQTPEARILDKLLTLIENQDGLQAKELVKKICDEASVLFKRIDVISSMQCYKDLHIKIMSFQLGDVRISDEEFIAKVKLIVTDCQKALPHNGEIMITAMRF